jgi:hypothetical protein
VPGFASRDDLINEITTNGKITPWNFYKIGPTAEAAGVWQSLWHSVGNPGAGTNPATTPGTVYDSDTTTIVAGSMPFPDVSTDQRYLLSFGAVASTNCTLMLYDRLAGVSGVATNSTGTKTINTGALTRYSGTDAVANEAWLEFTTAGTAATGVFNLNSYTSADGSNALTGGSVSTPTTSMAQYSMLQLPLAAGEMGVRSVEAGLNVGTAHTTSVANLMIIRPLARIVLLANQWNEVFLLDDSGGLPRIYDNANLGLMYLATATTATTFWGTLTTAYG